MGPLSWITPFISGTLKVKYRDFLKYNIPGVIVGIGIILFAGYWFGFSYMIILSKVRRDIFYILLVLLIVILIALLRKLSWTKIFKFIGSKISR